LATSEQTFTYVAKNDYDMHVIYSMSVVH